MFIHTTAWLLQLTISHLDHLVFRVQYDMLVLMQFTRTLALPSVSSRVTAVSGEWWALSSADEAQLVLDLVGTG